MEKYHNMTSCVQRLPTLADYVTLLAFAAERRAAGRRAVEAPAAGAIHRYILTAGHTTANPPQRRAAVDRWTRQSDRQTDGHHAVT